MNLTAVGCTVVTSLAVLGATSAPGAALAQSGPTITVTSAPRSEWVRAGEWVLSATATSPIGVWTAGWAPENERVRLSVCQGPYGVCPTSFSDTFTLRASTWPEEVRTIRFYAQDMEKRSNSKVFQVRVDRTPPSAPQDLRLVGGDGWRASNRFRVAWTKPSDTGSPFAGVVYRICPAANRPSDLRDCVTGERTGSDLEWLDDIAVPRSGVWRLRLALKDRVGNVDLDGGATVTNLRLDADPPEVAFRAADPSDPARIAVAASDAASGIARVTVEARREGEGVWRTLTVTGNAGEYSALLDDNDLPAGTYELRAHAVDNAGNERTAFHRLNGDPVRVRLPVREGTVVTAGVPKRGRALNASPTLPFGKSRVISGRITDAFGSPRAGAAIEVSERRAVSGAEWRPLTTLTADKRGAFAYRAKPGMARTVRFQHPGTPTTRPAAAEVALRVKAASTLVPSRRSLHNGDTVVLRGRLLGRPLPAAGKVVTVQARTRRGWVTFGTARARARDGRWSYRYTFTATSTTVRYRFRAVVLREQAYPYVRGTSPTVTVLVRGSRA